jgi:hypothetical protein
VVVSPLVVEGEDYHRYFGAGATVIRFPAE